MSRAVGAKKPQEAQKANALWKMKAAEEAGEEYYDPTREDNIQGRNRTRLAPQRSNCGAGQSPEVCEQFVLEVSARVLGGRSVLQWLALVSHTGCGKSRSGSPCGRAWIRWIVCLCTASTEWNVPVKYGPNGELFFFLVKKELAPMPDGETFSPFINADIRTTQNPRVLGSSEPTPEEPLRIGGTQAGLGQAHPAGSPIVWSRVQMMLRSTCIRLERRAACRDRRHQRHSEGANLDQFCHLRDCVSCLAPRHLRPVARVGRLQCSRKRICTQSSASKITDGMRLPWALCSHSVKELSGGGQNCAEAREHSAACYWAAFPVICHGGRRPRHVVAGLVERGLAVGSTRAEVLCS